MFTSLKLTVVVFVLGLSATGLGLPQYSGAVVQDLGVSIKLLIKVIDTSLTDLLTSMINPS